METFPTYDNLNIGATRVPSPKMLPTISGPVTPRCPLALVQQLYGYMNCLATRQATKPDPKEDVFDYFPLDAYGLNKKQLDAWKGLLVDIEGYKISVEGLAHPMSIASNPALLISVTGKLIAMHAAQAAQATEVPSSPSVGAGSIPGTGTAPSIVSTTPTILITTASGSQTLPDIPDPLIPKYSIHLNGSVFVGLQYNSVDIPGFFVNIMDLRFDSWNEVFLANKMWLKLRVVRECPQKRYKPSFLPGMGKELRKIEEQKHVNLAMPAPGLPLPLAFDHEAENTMKIAGDYYTQIREGFLKGYMIHEIGSFKFGGLDWVEEVLIVPSLDDRQTNRMRQTL